MQSNAQLQEEPLYQRNVSSTAKLFSFNRSVFMTDRVWEDCVELAGVNGRSVDELAVLQRLRHVLFMASSALHGRVADLECEFSIHRVPNDGETCRPEQTILKLVASTSDQDQPQIIIKHPCE
ncbi:MAG: hypothetical protein DIZ80_12335 [endosymbiont of Galathealinum brachiosum]|uniref:Uncharacterized protein n=1 Tax=endosymbiont of Galathealinum brachiosum TaxID=2200906 RepID=A0A370DDQ4_9GAMM|nr:MAG: hypothetical protein DIZ80_12335 [endosymbiont of Galathealinum brachiosum]